LHSDGLAEAHNEDREMFGFPRLIKVMENCPRHESLIDAVLAELDRFVGPEWEQEDDITLVTIERSPRPPS
jgi:serine phosphatase RsbU (regulator of sigma subunit)